VKNGFVAWASVNGIPCEGYGARKLPPLPNVFKGQRIESYLPPQIIDSRWSAV